MQRRQVHEPAFVALLALLISSPAWAQAGATANTLGQSTYDALRDLIGPIMIAISFTAFLVGLFLVGKGLIKLKDAANSRDGSYGAAATSLIAGTLLIALPEAAGMGMTSLLGANGIFGSGDLRAARILDATSDGGGAASQLSQRILSMVQIKGVDNCITSADPVPCLAKNVANNVVHVGVLAVFAFVFLAGLVQLGGAIVEVARHEQNRGSIPPGWWMKVFTAVLMMNGPFLLRAATQSITGQTGAIGGSGLMEGHSILRYSNVGGILAQYESVIGHIFTILTLFGAIAFVRGLFLMKSAAEGRSNSTLGHGITFLVAGVLLANSKVSTCIIMNTMMGSGFGFCSA